jgi:hypothetical protein
MDLVKKWGLLLTMGCFLGAQTFDDPVMKARLQRSQAQGIEESDLPPVPRGVMEPPPLPPPETHAKDSPHAQVTKAARHRAGRVRAGSKALPESRPLPEAKVRAGSRALPEGKVRAAKRGKAAPAAPAAKLNSAQKSRPARPARPAGKAVRPSRKRAKA